MQKIGFDTLFGFMMKKAIQAAVLLTVNTFATGCANTGGYLVDRGRDSADILTATVGVGAGAKLRIGPARAGLFRGVDTAGLRGGRIFRNLERQTSPDDPASISKATWDMLNALDFESTFSAEETFSLGLQGRNKNIALRHIFWTYDLHEVHLNYYTQLEIALGLGGTVRLGFNPGELLDFVLGLFTIDIFNDDLECKKRESNQEKRE